MSETTQIANSFDKETVKKILKSFLISAFSAAAIWTANYVLQAIGAISFSNAQISIFVAWTIPVLTYALSKVKSGTLTWAKFGWSFLLSAVAAGIIFLESETTWCRLGEVCTSIYSITALIAPTVINTIKEWIRGACGYKE